MKLVDFKDDYVRLYLRKSFYDNDVIMGSLNEYSDFIDYSFDLDVDYYVFKISLKSNDYDLEYVTYELLNYILGKEREVLA